MAAQFDGAGRTAAAAGFISKLGLASGPFIAGRLLGADLGFGALINAALIGLAISMVLMLVAARRLDLASRAQA